MIEISNLVKKYNYKKENEYEALRGISFKINDGTLTAIIGKSGAGKSTLIHIIAGIEDYEAGNCVVDGIELKNMREKEKAHYRNKKVGLVMQDYALIEDYTVYENIAVPLYFGKYRKKRWKKRINELLEYVDLSNIAHKMVSKLSGGQKQRVAIARALVCMPDIIIADEPTGALDYQTGKEIIELLKKLNSEGKTVIIVTHDFEIAQQCDNIITISDGNIIT